MLVSNKKCKYNKVFKIMNALIKHKLFTIGVLEQMKKIDNKKSHPSFNVKYEWG
jgi:hypothetical protein